MELVAKLKVESVPAVALLKPCNRGEQVIEGPIHKTIHRVLSEANEEYTHFFEKEKFKVYDEIEQLMRTHLLVVCIHGTKDDPKCRHSRELI